MVVYGYCPGTGVAAIVTGSLHALVGFGGMLFGGVLYAISYPWVKANILSVGAYGKIRLPEASSIPEIVYWVVLAVGAFFLFRFLDKRDARVNA